MKQAILQPVYRALLYYPHSAELYGMTGPELGRPKTFQL